MLDTQRQVTKKVCCVLFATCSAVALSVGCFVRHKAVEDTMTPQIVSSERLPECVGRVIQIEGILGERKHGIYIDRFGGIELYPAYKGAQEGSYVSIVGTLRVQHVQPLRDGSPVFFQARAVARPTDCYYIEDYKVLKIVISDPSRPGGVKTIDPGPTVPAVSHEVWDPFPGLVTMPDNEASSQPTTRPSPSETDWSKD